MLLKKMRGQTIKPQGAQKNKRADKVECCNSVSDYFTANKTRYFFNIFHIVSGIEIVNPRNEVKI